ncbi:MAG TPA: hypothetical protein V6C57_17565 [Coleofasciculaceae cyanobacterium]
MQPKSKGKLAVQMDESGSFVDHQGNQQWVWLALGVATREDRWLLHGRSLWECGKGVWESMPDRQCAVIYTDCWEAYPTVLSSNHHFAVGQESGLTRYIERFNTMLRNGCRA